jgi:hypothetical protein
MIIENQNRLLSICKEIILFKVIKLKFSIIYTCVDVFGIIPKILSIESVGVVYAISYWV